MRRLLLLLALPLLLGADRHVYLNESGGGTQLDDCPNPSHNAKGTSNTDELEYCAGGGAQAGKVIGTATGRIAAATCTGAGGTVTAVTNGVSADVDGDGTNETVYGHPQACVWNMAKSDSCEIHSGTYETAGAYADANAMDSGLGGGAGCDKHTCWWATVVAYGNGPNMGATGYGTAGSPGWLRGAVMGGSTDTWDSDGDKIPDTEAGEPTSYPVIFSGDLNNNATFEAATCDDTSCTAGDAYYGLQVGCHRTDYDFCKTNHTDWVTVDTDANGTYETKMDDLRIAVDYFQVKDIEFTGYNGGHTSTTSGVRAREGIIGLEGIGDTEGLKVDHVYMHGNDYSLQPSSENFWAFISDSHNGNCIGYTEIKDSLLYQNNEKGIDDDCGGASNKCGCMKYYHDNRHIIDITSSRAATRSLIVPFYYKAIDISGGDDVPKAPRIWNNEFIINALTTGGSMKFMDLQAFGNNSGSGQGELWVYGNVFRRQGTTAKFTRFWFGSCGVGTGSGRVYFFNNTMDMDFTSNGDGIYQVCAGINEELIVEKNNAYWTASVNINTHDTPADTATRANEFCSITDTSCTVPGSVGHGDWFVGTPTTNWDGLSYLAPVASGPLDNITANTACDPDGDGVTGVDYDGDGANDTSWTDIAGNIVSCPTTTTAIDIGAIQNASSPVGGTGNILRGAKLTSGKLR